MTHSSIRSLLTACALSTLSVSLWAQNLAIVNGKAVPKARAEVLADLAATGWTHRFDAARRDIARETSAVREFSDECRFWAARRE